MPRISSDFHLFQAVPPGTGMHFMIALAALLVAIALPVSGASFNRKAETEQLMRAMRDDRYDEARALLKAGVDPNADYFEGQSLFYSFSSSEQRHRAKYLELLLDSGARVDIQTDRGDTPLHAVAFLDDVDSIRLMVRRGADIEASTCNGEMPLGIAASAGRMKAVKVLLELGARINYPGESRRATCVNWVAVGFEVAKLLISGGLPANSGGRASGRRKRPFYYEQTMPALSHAVRQGHYEVAQFLLSMGADPNAKSAEFSVTSLMFLADSCRRESDQRPVTSAEMAESLLRAGAKLDLRNDGGYTAAELASDGGCAEILPVLRGEPAPKRRAVAALQDPRKPRVTHPELREELLGIETADSRSRRSMPVDPAVAAGATTDKATRLRALVERYGWPTNAMVGEDGARIAAEIAVQAVSNPEFQAQALALMEPLAERQKIYPMDYARLYDLLHRPQRFGTQGSCGADGAWSPHEIEDEGNIDVRRAQLGLDPMKEHIRVGTWLCQTRPDAPGRMRRP